MAATNINRVVLTGNLTRDPELRSLPSGTSVCSLRVACNTRRKDNSTGEWVDKPNYFDVTVWGAQGENCAQYLVQGTARRDRRSARVARVGGQGNRQEAPVGRYHCRFRPVPRFARRWRERRPVHAAERCPGRHRRLRVGASGRRGLGRRHPVLTPK